MDKNKKINVSPETKFEIYKWCYNKKKLGLTINDYYSFIVSALMGWFFWIQNVWVYWVFLIFCSLYVLTIFLIIIIPERFNNELVSDEYDKIMNIIKEEQSLVFDVT